MIPFRSETSSGSHERVTPVEVMDDADKLLGELAGTIKQEFAIDSI